MKKLLLAASAVLSLVSAGQAADMPVKAARVAPLPSVFSWTGFYIGGTVGYGWGNPHHDDGGGFRSPSFDIDGAVAGVTVGVNYQINRIVLGFEGDWSWANIEGTTPQNPAFCGTVCTTEIKSFATARGRLGVTLIDRLLVFGTAGAAWTRISGSINGVQGATDTKSGWTAGGGLEWAITDQFSFKAEYLHVDVPDFAYDTPLVCGGIPCSTVRNSFDVVRAGLNYRFGWGGPVVARY
jgi:outer membrane immunogenic protein